MDPKDAKFEKLYERTCTSNWPPLTQAEQELITERITKMDARSTAVQRAILNFCEEYGIHVRKTKKDGALINVEMQSEIGATEYVRVRDMATYVADKMKPE